MEEELYFINREFYFIHSDVQPRPASVDATA